MSKNKIENEKLNSLSSINKRKVESIKKEIDFILDKFSSDYKILADRSESGCANEDELKREYGKLDEKTGLNQLYEKLNDLFI